MTCFSFTTGTGCADQFHAGAGAINTMNNARGVGFRRAVWGVLGQQVALLIQLVIVAVDLVVMWLFFALVGRAFRRLTSTPSGQR